jgi:hypothetical protein
MITKATAGLVLAAILLLSACGESESEKAMADVCAARDDIAEQVDHLKGLTLTTATGDEVRTSLQTIRNDLSKIRGARADLTDEQRKDVQAANDTFAETVQSLVGDVGSSVSLADAAAQIKSSLQNLAASYESTFGELDCS